MAHSHEEVATYWYDQDHEDCSILRQGDVFQSFLDDGGDYLVVVSQSCNIREEPNLDVTVARADLVETYVAENGAAIHELEFWRKGYANDRFMLPRRPGHFETELLVHLDDLTQLPAKTLCDAVEQGFAVGRATDMLTTVVGHHYGNWVNRPAVRRPIPTFDWDKAQAAVDPFRPEEPPYAARPIELTAKRLTGKVGSPRDGEVWIQVGVKQWETVLSSTALSVDVARLELAEQLTELLAEGTEVSSGLQNALSVVRRTYFD